MEFKLWLNESKHFTGLKPSDVNWWASYAKNWNFKSEQEARDWIFDKRQHHDRDPHVDMFGGPDGPEFNRAFASAMPIYMSGKSFKIGKRLQKDNRLKLKNIEIRKPDLEELDMVAQANGESDYKFHPVKWIRVKFSENDYYLNSPKTKNYIIALANQIKQNKWIEAIIYDYSDGSIIEGNIVTGKHGLS